MAFQQMLTQLAQSKGKGPSPNASPRAQQIHAAPKAPKPAAPPTGGLTPGSAAGGLGRPMPGAPPSMARPMPQAPAVPPIAQGQNGGLSQFAQLGGQGPNPVLQALLQMLAQRKQQQPSRPQPSGGSSNEATVSLPNTQF